MQSQSNTNNISIIYNIQTTGCIVYWNVSHCIPKSEISFSATDAVYLIVQLETKSNLSFYWRLSGKIIKIINTTGGGESAFITNGSHVATKFAFGSSLWTDLSFLKLYWIMNVGSVWARSFSIKSSSRKTPGLSIPSLSSSNMDASAQDADFNHILSLPTRLL